MRQISSDIAWQIVGDSAVLVDVRRGASIALNDTATFIWERLVSSSDDTIARELAREFSVTEDAARRDVEELVGVLRERRVIL